MRNYSEEELNQARIWNTYAERGYLQSTIDPRDEKGLKCGYIDRWARHYIREFVLTRQGINVLEIGCGSGRNLFALAPFIENGFGIDVAEKQIENAEARRLQLKIENVSFFMDPETFFKSSVGVQSVFTMWVLAGFESDENLLAMLSEYRDKVPGAERFVFFEQVAQEGYVVNEEGCFYKKVRAKDDYTAILSKAGFKIKEFRILNEKGFGPLYRLFYRSW